MASRISVHVDGKQYRRDFSTGRIPLPSEYKAQHQMISLPPQLKAKVKSWKALTGKSYSEWVADKMDEIYIETV